MRAQPLKGSIMRISTSNFTAKRTRRLWTGSRSGCCCVPLVAGLLALLAAPRPLMADLGGPEAESVYGGRVNNIDAVATGASSSTVFLATESANSLFCADVDHSVAPPLTAAFQTIPDVDADDGYGSGIQLLAADEASGWLFFVHQSGLYRVTDSAGSLTLVDGAPVAALEVHGGMLFYLENGDLHFGTIGGASGAFLEHADSPIAAPAFGGDRQALFTGAYGGSDHLFILDAKSTAPLYRSSDAMGSFSAATTFGALSVTGLSTPEDYCAAGAGPDERVFLGGVIGSEPFHGKGIAYLDSGSAVWTELDTGIGGTAGNEIHCAGGAASYYVYFGTAMSDDRGDSGTWSSIGDAGFETHPNDGAVISDPLDATVIYMTTDQGIGSSLDNGATIFEIDDGLEAVQVRDLEMDSDKNIAWVASKSGIRQVTDYQTSPVWSNAVFPNNDGSPYYSIAMDTTDHTGNTVLAGNCRVYATDDGGGTWTQTLDAQQAPWNLDFFSWVSSIEVDPYDPARVAAGYYAQDESMKGMLFASEDGGASFSEITGGAMPVDGGDINDILFLEESGTSVFYVGMDYTYSLGYGTSYAVCRVEGSAMSGWTVTQDMTHAVSIKDMALDGAGGIYAVGCDNSDHPVVYYKTYGSGSWTVMSWSGLPASGSALAVTVGDDGTGVEAPYVAVNTGIYLYDTGAASWSLEAEYPDGTQINVIYYDDLLVGTGTGLYGHQQLGDAGVGAPGASSYMLGMNYPNPFNPNTSIAFNLPAALRVRLTVYDVLGRNVGVLVDGRLGAGGHELTWRSDGKPSGVYFYRLESSLGTQTRRMILLK